MKETDTKYFTFEFAETKGAFLVEEDAVSYKRSEDATDLSTQLKKRTFALAVDIVNLLDSTSDSPAIRVIRYQLLKSATSVGANYRAVCRARSDKEFYAKLCIVVEEADETVYWLALLLKSKVSIDKFRTENLMNEAAQLSNFFSKSRATMRKRLKG